MKKIYLDHAATTYVDERVFEEMKPYFMEKYGNPSSFHSLGLEAKDAVDNARKKVASLINADAKEIIFTGSGTESVNLAIKGVAFSLKDKGKHIITSKIEHPAVLNTCKYLEKQGFRISYLPVDKYGIVKLSALEKVIDNDTILVSIMYANNEIGTIQPIEEIAKICHKHGIIFHTDACQAAGLLEIDVKKLDVDLMSMNGSKIYAPKGVGCLYVRKGVKLEPLIYGGGHEFGLRSGTENVPYIVGFAKALEIAQAEKEKESKRLEKLRDMLIQGLMKIPGTYLNGHPKKRLPNNVNISFDAVEGEAILLHLNENGICASTGSACSSHSLEPSHVLKALGLPYEIIHGSIRFSLGKKTTEQDIEYVIKVMTKIIEELRSISPLSKQKKENTSMTKTIRKDDEWFYSDVVKEHFFNPRNIFRSQEEIENYNEDGVGIVGSAICGDMMKMWIKVKDGRIDDCKWQTFGCGSAIASTSMLSEMIKGMPLEKAMELKPMDIVKKLKYLPQRKIHCSVLGTKALKEAIRKGYRTGCDARC